MKRLLPLLLVVLTGAGLWLVFSSPEPASAEAAPAPETETAATSPTAAQSAAPKAAESAGAPVNLSHERVEIADSPKVSPPSAAAFEPPCTDDDALSVLVLQPDGETPAPRATVYFADPQQVSTADAFRSLRQLEDLTSTLDAISRRFRTDDQGLVNVPRPESGLVIGALTTDNFQLQIFEDLDDQDQVEVVLQPRSQIQAQVFGPDGRPVEGVPVALMLQFGNNRQPILNATTRGKDGIATMRDFAPLGKMGPMAAAGMEIALALPLAETVSEPVILSDLPEEPYLLLLPPTGKVVVEAVDYSGKPIEEEIDVALRIKPASNGPRSLFRMNRMVEQISGSESSVVVLKDGEARFPFVGLGLELRATAALPDYLETIEVTGAGPTAPDQTVRLRLQPDTPAAVIVGRVLDQERQLLTKTEIEISRTNAEGGFLFGGRGRLTTDEKGRFRHPLQLEPSGATQGGKLDFRLPGKSWGLAVAEGSYALPDFLPFGETDLGDIVLAEQPFLASGVIVGPAGEPIADASVRPQWKAFYRNDSDQFWWKTDWRQRAVSQEDGSFELRGTLPEEAQGQDLQIYVDAEGYRSAETPFLVGATNLRIEMPAAGALSGRILVDEGIPAQDLGLEFAVDREEGPHSQFSSPEPDGTFSWTSLDPGVGTLKVRANRSGEVVFAAQGVRVVAGENRDPRLDPIDLRGALTLIHLTFVDENGDAVPGAAVAIQNEGMRRHEWANNGKLQLLAGEQGVDLIASSSGYFSVPLKGLRNDRKIVFRTAGRLTFVLDPPVALPDQVKMYAQLKTPESRLWTGMRERQYFDASGVLSLPLTAAGEFNIEIGVQSFQGNSSFGRMLFNASSPATVTIDNPAADQTVSLRIDQEKLEQQIEGLIPSDG